MKLLGYKDILVTAIVHYKFVYLYNLTPVFNRPRAYPIGECELLLVLPLGKSWL